MINPFLLKNAPACPRACLLITDIADDLAQGPRGRHGAWHKRVDLTTVSGERSGILNLATDQIALDEGVEEEAAGR